MGCSCSGRSVNAYKTSYKESKYCEEVEEIAELPARAMKEDFDLVTIVELSVKCTNLYTADKHSVDPVVFFLVEELPLINEIGETILPETEGSPGAKSLKVANFIDLYVTRIIWGSEFAHLGRWCTSAASSSSMLSFSTSLMLITFSS